MLRVCCLQLGNRGEAPQHGVDSCGIGSVARPTRLVRYPDSVRAVARTISGLASPGPPRQHDDIALPEAARPARSRFHDAAQSHHHGQHAHRPGGCRPRLPAHGGVLRRAGAARRRPDRHRRLRTELRGLGQALRRHPLDAQRRAPPQAGDGRGARRERQDRAADPAHRPLRLLAAVRRAEPHPEPDLAVHPARADGARHRAPDQGLRALRGARARGRLRRRRGDGQRGLPDQPVPGSPRQPPYRRMGRRLREPDAAGGGDRAPRARGCGARLHPDLPDLDDRPDPRGQHLGRGAAAGQGRGGRRRHHLEHRHRLARGAHPDHRHQRAACGLRLGHRKDARRLARRRRGDPAGHQQPHQHARGGRRAARGRHRPVRPGRPGVDGGRSWPTRRSSRRRRRAEPTRSTPASPATRPASTTPSATSRRPAWSIRAPASRPS